MPNNLDDQAADGDASPEDEKDGEGGTSAKRLSRVHVWSKKSTVQYCMWIASLPSHGSLPARSQYLVFKTFLASRWNRAVLHPPQPMYVKVTTPNTAVQPPGPQPRANSAAKSD